MPPGLQARLRRVQQIEASFGAYAAILVDGTVVTWGLPECGGHLDPLGIEILESTFDFFRGVFFLSLKLGS